MNTTAPGWDEIAIGLIPALLMLAVAYAVLIVVCYLLYTAMLALPPHHRKMEPGLVWLLLIPLFNLVWNFFVFLRVPESYQSYFHSIGRHDVGDAGRSLGLTYAILAAVSLLPCIGILTSIAALVILILFLVKIMGLKNQVGSAGPGGFPMTPNPPGA